MCGGPLRRVFLPAGAGMLCMIAVAAGQESSGEDPVMVELHQKIDLFFRNLADTETSAESAFAGLLAGSRLARPENEPAVKTLAAQTAEFDKKYGAYLGHEAVGAARIGGNLVLLKYLYEAADFPVVWRFTYYRAGPENPWVVVAVRFDTNLEALGP